MADTTITIPDLGSLTSGQASDLLLATRGTTGYKMLLSDLAKYMVETYNSSSLAGSAQSVKNALDSLNSRFASNAISFVMLPGNAGAENNAIQFTVNSASDTTEYIYFLFGMSASNKIFAFIAYMRFSAQVINILSFGDAECTGIISETTAIIKVNNWMTGFGISRNQVANISFVSAS